MLDCILCFSWNCDEMITGYEMTLISMIMRLNRKYSISGFVIVEPKQAMPNIPHCSQQPLNATTLHGNQIDVLSVNACTGHHLSDGKSLVTPVPFPLNCLLKCTFLPPMRGILIGCSLSSAGFHFIVLNGSPGNLLHCLQNLLLG